MERTTWTDERLDDFSRRMDAGFATVHADLRDLRSEVRADMAELRTELRGELSAFRLTILRVGGGIMVGLVGVIAAVVTHGA
jgi:hypothetical protein